MKVQGSPTSGEDTSRSQGEDELARVLEAYIAELEAGRAVDTRRLMAEHPAIADRLRVCLGSLRLVERAADAVAIPRGAPDHAGPERRLGDYRILREVGRGGMGVVYEAEQISLRRRVALKVLPFAAAIDPRQLQRFQLEAQAAATLHHPHIVPVYGVGCERGVHYYAMQFVDGRTLADVIRELRSQDGLEPLDPGGLETAACASDPALLAPREPAGAGLVPRAAADELGSRMAQGDVSPAESRAVGSPRPSTGSSVRSRDYLRTVARLGVQAAEALEHAHRQGLVHRDVKPSNLLVDTRGDLWITDFGLARCQVDHGLTMTGDMLGTLRYMSPEQALAKRVGVDHRSDIYSLGVTLYEMLTLRPAVEGRDRAEILRRLAENEARPVRRLNPAVPYDLETVVAKSMDKDAAARYATAGEMAEDLGRYLAHQPVRARRPSLADRAVKCARRNKAAMAAVVTLLLAAAVGLGVVAAWRDAVLRRHNGALRASLEAVERKEWINRRYLYGSQVRLAQQELAAGQVEFAQEALERLRPGSGDDDPRGFEWYYLRRLAHRDVSLLFGHEAPVYTVAVAPDGRTLVSGDGNRVLIFWDLVGWRELARTPVQAGSVYCLAFSPDGRAVASASVGRAHEVKVWDPITGREAARITGLSKSSCGLAFSHDGRTLAVDETCSAGRVSFWSVSARPARATSLPPPVPCSYFAVSPDHRLVATSGRAGRVTLRDLSTGRANQTLSERFATIHAVAFTPDGRSVLVIDESRVSLFDVATGAEAGRITATGTGLPSLTLGVEPSLGLPLQNGETFWLTGGRADLRPIFLEAAGGAVRRFRFSPDGGTLAATDPHQHAVLWETSSGKKLAAYPLRQGPAHALSFTPRGESLIMGSEDARVRVWHIEARPEPSDRLSGHDAEVWALAYTPDGRTLATAADDHTIKLWDPRDGAERATLRGHGSLVTSLAVSPDGRTLASGGFDKTVRLWDLPSGRPRAVLRGHTDRVRGVAFSPDGRLLASAASDFTIRLWDTADGRGRGTLLGHTDGLHALAFDPRGRHLVSAGNDATLRVWDLVDGRGPLTVSCPKSNTALAFSSDGSLLASGDDGGNMIVWDTDTWTRRTAIQGSDAPIWGVGFSADGRTLAAACGDARVRLWDPVTGQLTLVLEGHARRVNTVAFSPDGATLASASHDGVVRLWHAEQP